jgi:NitT/TauT family transport system substrate-binding protein
MLGLSPTVLRLVAPVILLSLAGCRTAPAPPPTPITVQLSFLHQAEFAGFYAADQLGLYAAEGLQVSFQEGGPEVDFQAPVLDGSAEFGVSQPADLILARAAGRPLRSIAAIYRRSPIAFIALAETGITRPQDFAGKKIRSTKTLDLTLQAMTARVDLLPDQYETVYLPSDISLFASGEVPVWGAFVNVFGLDVERAGYQVNVIYPDDYGIHFYGDILVTTDDLIARDPDLVLRFVRATLKGWTYAVEHPDAIGAMVAKYNPDADRDLEIARMTASIPLVNTGEDFVGWMKPEIWSGMEQTLREQGLLDAPLDVAQAYTLDFLEEIYAP